MTEEILLQFGGEIKSLGGDKIGGHLVLFSDAGSPDLMGDYFTKDTDFGIEDGAKTAVYLNHRLPLKTAKGGTIAVKEKIGEGTLSVDDSGVLIEAILFNRKKYEKALTSMGWSSGSAAHLVDREKNGKAHFIKSWPLGLDASVTPIPCEPRTSVVTLKSYQDEIEIEEDIFDQLKAVIPEDTHAGLRFDERLDLVLAAAERVVTDATEIQEMRVKSGRKISKARMDKLKQIMGQLEALLMEADPPPAEEKSAPDVHSFLAELAMTRLMRQRAVRRA